MGEKTEYYCSNCGFEFVEEHLNFFYDDETKSSYRFEFDKEYFHGIGDGTFDMVLTSSDNGEIGKVLLQIVIEIKCEKITLDFENRK